LVGGGTGAAVGATVGANSIPCPETAANTSSTSSTTTATATAVGAVSMAEHRPKKQSTGSKKKNAPKHEKGTARKQRDKGGEKGV